MSEKERPVVFDDDNPEWTEEDFAHARPAAEAHPPEVAAMLVRKRGRPPGSRNGSRKEQIALRVDADVLAAYRAEGPGWQTRMNEALRAGLARKRA
jgi:uncharacterized protein (DUF4415 family)